MVNTVLFDLDGTLLNRDVSIQNFASDQYERLTDRIGNIPKEIYVSRFIELDNRGYVWKDKVYQQIVKEFHIEGITWEGLLADYLAYFKHFCVPFPGLQSMLKKLKAKSISLGIITNGFTHFQMSNIDALGIKEFFDIMLISESEGIKKPDIQIFNRAIHYLKSTPQHCIFVGDHPINDIDGAKNAGMITVWKKDNQWEKVNADFAIDQLTEIIEIVEKLQSRSAVTNLQT
ncbi:L-2-haloalkanoic acid dehalogenase [Fictibacillus arsenicus]|uniref:L-2-haloalkanoic acid dehalogenase n=1 Tax=Fictibacillus arsenicus TaxID=255247 RepID=A0A1B1Z2C6_9BACL|nr:HAD family hydrolase [Fictibacillus arsenicus]ANX11597.1 L-2-haloalkanoic acid dehalogenase [Fictibacillus arsenicus]